MEFCVFALQPAHSRHWLKPVFDGELSSVAPCGRRLFNCRRGQAPTLPLSSHFRLTSRQSPAMPKFSVGQEPDPPGYYPPIAVRHSLFAIRHSLSFWLSRSLALPFFSSSHAPILFRSLFPVPCPLSHFICSVRRLNIFTQDSETDEGGISEPPLTLGDHRVRCLPVW